jgi:ATP/maltotriose-dependent transcriptional regulator MalT
MVYHGQTFEMFQMIDSVREIIENEDLPERERELLLAECYCLLTYRVYHIDQDFEKCIEYGEFALSKLPVECHYPIGFAWVFLGGALQAKGRSQEAIDKLYKAIDKSISEDIKNMTLLVINYIYWLEGDSDHLKKSSEQLIEYGKANHNSEAIVNGYLFLGSYYYMIGDLQNAAISYENVLSMRYHVIGIQSFFGITALIYTYLFSKEFGKLDATALELDHIVNEAGGQVFRSFWKAFDAEIKMFRSQTPQALNWLKNAHEFPLIPITNYSDPHLSMIRILLMEGSMENMNKALKILEELEEMLTRTNNRRVSASIYVGKAIYFNKMQDSEKSATFIVQALVIAELGNNVMVFVEYGQLVIPAIRNYTKLNGAHHLLSKAFTLINRNDSIIDQKDFTHRELEIIPLLNLSNKEIAKKLFISEKTVKRHSNSIFKKLQVKNRREAYQKAKEMKLP